MPKHTEILEADYSSKKLYDMVLDVEKYPEFLPWCKAAKITEKDSKKIIAVLVIEFKGITEKYTSKITFEKNKRIHVEMIEGPFKHLINRWEFIEKSKNKTEIKFFIDFEFNNLILGALIGFIFKKAIFKLSNAFIDRAKNIL